MTNVPDTPLGRMYREHIEMLEKKQLDKLLREQYAPDALLISSNTKAPLYFRGRAQIRTHMEGILGIENLEAEVVFWAETDDPQTLMVTEKISFLVGGQRANMRFADSWVLRDGKIAIHFAGMVQHADGSLA
jgi:SnoaL-like protein